MLRFLLDKFKQASGPFKQARLVTGDLAEEMLDLSDYYLKRIRTRLHWTDAASGSSPEATDVPLENLQPQQAPKPVVTRSATEPFTRQLEVSKQLADALDVPQYRKKQEFKVLAILFDAQARGLGQLSAKEVSEHGAQLGLSIRHENVRKVIRMRLDQKVTVQTVVSGSGSIYKYTISEEGAQYFRSKYLTN